MSPPPAFVALVVIAARQLQALAQPVHISRGLEADQVHLSSNWEVQRVGISQSKRVHNDHGLGLHRYWKAIKAQPVIHLEVRHCHDAEGTRG